MPCGLGWMETKARTRTRRRMGREKRTPGEGAQRTARLGLDMQNLQEQRQELETKNRQDRQASLPGLALGAIASTELETSAMLALQNGTYTISHPKRGHFTVKVHTAQQGQLAGRRIISMLTGPDNTADYRGVAFWNDDERDHEGKRWPQAKVWSRFRGPRSELPLDGYHYQYQGGWNSVEQKLAIFLDLALRALNVGEDGRDLGSHWRSQGYEIQRSSRCVRCNRELTDPESLRIGQGPECRSKP